MLRERLEGADWAHVAADALPFLAPGTDPGLLTLENALRVVGQA